MNYGDFKTLIQEVNTGASMPTSIDAITKLVLGKMSRLRIRETVRTAEITVSGGTEFLLSTHIPDFLAFKTDPNRNKKTGPYFYQSTDAYFLRIVNDDKFAYFNASGGNCCIKDGVLHVNWPSGFTVPDTLYVPIWGKFMVLDHAGGTLKEEPNHNNDTFIFNSMFDDVLVEGVLLYCKRINLNDHEFLKAVQEWNRSLKDLMYYQ